MLTIQRLGSSGVKCPLVTGRVGKVFGGMPGSETGKSASGAMPNPLLPALNVCVSLSFLY